MDPRYLASIAALGMIGEVQKYSDAEPSSNFTYKSISAKERAERKKKKKAAEKSRKRNRKK